VQLLLMPLRLSSSVQPQAAKLFAPHSAINVPNLKSVVVGNYCRANAKEILRLAVTRCGFILGRYSASSNLLDCWQG